MKYFKFLFVITAGIFLACQPKRMVEKPVVVTSISVYEDLVKQIAGSACEVHSLVQGMENPHTFDLSGSKIRQVAQADLLVLNGLGLEGWSRQLLAGIDTSHTRYVFVADSLMNSPLLIHNDNPHFWMDPRIGQQIVNILLPEIQALVPDSQAIFRERAAGYLEELEQLYHDIGVKLEPLKSNKVIAQTPGLDYFFSAFGIERTDVIVSHPGTEPSARKMKELVDLLQTGEVFAIIRFPQFSEKLPQTLSTESNVPVVLMSPLINGAPYVETYIDLIWFNADALANIASPNA